MIVKTCMSSEQIQHDSTCVGSTRPTLQLPAHAKLIHFLGCNVVYGSTLPDLPWLAAVDPEGVAGVGPFSESIRHQSFGCQMVSKRK